MRIVFYLEKEQTEALQAGVKHLDAEWVAVHTDNELLQKLQNEDFDIVLLRGEDNFKTTKVLDKISYEQSVFVVTNTDSIKEREYWFALGILYVFNIENLIEYISDKLQPKVRTFFEYNVAILSNSKQEFRRMFALAKEIDTNPKLFSGFEKIKTAIETEERIDMLLIDINITEKKVVELIELVRYDINLNEIPIIVCCDEEDTKNVLDYFKIGMSNYILRPYLREQIAPLLFNILSNLKFNVELRKLIDELMELDKTKNKFISACSHDLKAPLNSLIGSIEIIDDENMVNEDGEVFVNVLKESSQFMLEVINDLLAISALKEGKNLSGEKVDLKEVCVAVVNAFRINTNKKGQNLIFDCDTQYDYFVAGHALSLKRVLNNLISNAIKFTPRMGDIRIYLGEEAGNIILSVKDTGIGIPEDMKDKIFDSFTKAGREGTDGEASTGLGLSLVKDIIVKTGGDVFVESEEGKGTKFTVQLPKLKVAAKVA